MMVDAASTSPDLSGDELNIHELAASLIAQSPPSQSNDVIQDIRIILGAATSQGKSNGQLESVVRPHIEAQLKKYYRAQFQPVKVDNGRSEAKATIVSEAAVYATEGGEERYVDPRAHISYVLDHIPLAVSDIQPHRIPETHEALRSSLESSLDKYLANHYASSKAVGVVFSSSRPLRSKTDKVEEIATDVAATPESANLLSQEDATKEQTEVSEEKVLEAESPVTESLLDKVVVHAEGLVDAVRATVIGDTAETDKDTREPKPESPASAEPTEITDAIVESADVSSPSKGETLPIEEKGEEKALETAGGNEEAVAEVEPPHIEPSATEEVESVEEVEAVESVDKVGKAEEAEEVEEVQEVQEDPIFTINIVGDKINASNFWTGRWRSRYIINPKEDTVQAFVRVDVHYFEAGNVQLDAKHTGSFPLPEDTEQRAGQILTAISKFESDYQLQLNETYSELSEKAFKSLRRALPIFRQKLDWEKIGAYKVGWDQIAEGKRA